MHRKTRDTSDRSLHMIDRDKSRTLELPRTVFVSRTPKEIFVVELQMRIVPTAIASVKIDDAIWGIEFV